MIRKLIIGSEGEIGKELQKSDNFVTIDIKESKNKNHFIADVTNTKAIEEIIEKENINEIMFLSSLLVNASEANKAKAREINVDSLVNLFPIIKKNNIKVLFTSSIAIYDTSNNIDPSTQYGLLKKEAEEAIAEFNKENKLIKVLRIPSVIDKESRGVNGITSFAGESFNTDHELTIGVSKEKRFPGIFKEDLPNAFKEFMNSNEWHKDVQGFSINGNEVEEVQKIKIIEQIDENKNNILLSWPDNMDKNRLFNIKLSAFNERSHND